MLDKAEAAIRIMAQPEQAAVQTIIDRARQAAGPPAELSERLEEEWLAHLSELPGANSPFRMFRPPAALNPRHWGAGCVVGDTAWARSRYRLMR
jgi:hypothetical protein